MSLPPAKALLADRGHDADGLREALADRKTEACIPPKKNRKIKLKDGRRIATRYDRCPHTFMSAIAAIVICWLGSGSHEVRSGVPASARPARPGRARATLDLCVRMLHLNQVAARCRVSSRDFRQGPALIQFPIHAGRLAGTPVSRPHPC
ncbi:hypothetical protein EYE42_10730 [Paracoccus subflavus]|uniref:Transposase DDE domain-containing protein n=1 Tax=Paracoccus subflavus TaxID=2528244 RepID=A0A4Q9G0N0_9RHOB|nr:hypothetical protein EYE42_10730 [Paracoccus subflavus]